MLERLLERPRYWQKGRQTGRNAARQAERQSDWQKSRNIGTPLERLIEIN